jgi:hypothetical protein
VREFEDFLIGGKTHVGEVDFAKACEKEIAACPDALDKFCGSYI